MQLDKVLDKRRSIRKFMTSKKVNWRKVIQAIEAAGKTPLAGNIHTMKFILVDDEQKINELAQAAQQPFIADASYVVVVCSDYSQLTKLYDERAEIYGRQQAGAAIENFLLKITDLGLATCWIGAFSEEIIQKICKIPQGIIIEALLPVGYEFVRTKKPKKRITTDLDNLIYFNEYRNKYMKDLRKPEGV